ncbi:MAG: FIST N-terminal domain-containing protein [bacterium]
MAFFAGVGSSKQINDSYAAGHDAASFARTNSGHDEVSLAVVVASSAYDQEAMLKGVREALGGASVVGCTNAGAITGNGVEEQAVTVLVLYSDSGSFVPAKVVGIGKDMRAAGKKFGEEIQKSDEKARMAFVFSDALAGNGTELVRGILDVFGSDFKIAGGAAGDDMNFKKTYQYFNDEVLTDAVVGFGLSGDIEVVVGASHGWQPIGGSRVVTKAEGTKLIELDGKPAFQIYQDYFGEKASDFKKALSLEAVTYPMGMKVKGVDELMVRVPLAVADDGSIVCGAEVVEGSEVYIMIGTIASAMEAAKETTQGLVDRMSDTDPRVVFVSDCVARKILFGEHGQEEITLLKSIGGPKSVIFGFYSYGQIASLRAPAPNINTCDPGFYEQSISVTVFG